MLHTFSINISAVTGAVWSTLSPGVPQGSGSLGGHVVAIGCPLLAADPCSPLQPTAVASLSSFPSQRVLELFTAGHTTIFFLFLGDMLPRGDVSGILRVSANVGHLACLPAALPDLGTTRQEEMPGGGGKRVKMTQGCLRSTSSTSWAMQGG